MSSAGQSWPGALGGLAVHSEQWVFKREKQRARALGQGVGGVPGLRSTEHDPKLQLHNVAHTVHTGFLLRLFSSSWIAQVTTPR